MAGPAGFTTDDVSDVTVLRELEKIKKFIVGKTVKDFSITDETETTIKVSITTNDKTWDVTLPRGGVIPQNLVYTDVNQEIESEKKFKQRVEFEIAEGNTLESDNVAVKTEIETPEGLLVSQGVVAEAKESGVKVSKYNDGLECEISFGEGVVVSDPYTESDNVTTKNGMIKVLREDVDDNSDAIGDLDLDKEDKNNKVSAWSATPNDSHYPSEKLVFNSFNQIRKTNIQPISVTGIDFGLCKYYKLGKLVMVFAVIGVNYAKPKSFIFKFENQGGVLPEPFDYASNTNQVYFAGTNATALTAFESDGISIYTDGPTAVHEYHWFYLAKE